MKAGFVFLTLVFSFLLARSQANYYVFLQSDNGRPFYVRVHQKRYEATFNGLLSIPGFKTGSNYLRIGFPGMQEEESLFRIVLQHQDMALQLRNKDQGGWGLYDWGSGQWIAPVSDTVLAPVQDSALVQTVKRSNAFAGLMAAVVNDSSMLYSSREQRLELPATVARTKEAVSDTMAALNNGNMPVAADIAVKADSNWQKGLELSGVADSGKLATAQNTAGNQFKDSVQIEDSAHAAVAEPVAGLAKDKIADSSNLQGKEPARLETSETILAANTIRKLMVNDVKGGRQILYELMQPDGSRDSVRVFIPAEEEEIRKPADAGRATAIMPPALQQPKKDTLATAAQSKDSLLLSRQWVADNSNAAGADKAAQNTVQMVNSDCRNFASEQDLDKLRLVMLDQDSSERRIAAALKVFRTKCFSTRQIRALSELFNTDDGRYRFFEAAYPYVSDTDHYPDLLGFFTDPYYIQRFKTLVHR